MNNTTDLLQTDIPEKPKGTVIEVEMHYCDMLIINCHDHDGKTDRKIYETKTVFSPVNVMAFRKSSGFMYHALNASIKAEQHDEDDERVL